MIILNQLPNVDNFLEVWLEHGEVERKIPNFKKSSDACLIFYGVLSSEIEALMPKIHSRSVELSVQLQEQNLYHDIMIKPIFLFEQKSCAEFFSEFLNSCNEEELTEVINELQLEHNEPWGAVDLLTEKQTKDIVSHYLTRFSE